MTTTTEVLERLEADYRAKVAKIQVDESLSWEKRERTIRELGLEYDRQRKEAESENTTENKTSENH